MESFRGGNNKGKSCPTFWFASYSSSFAHYFPFIRSLLSLHSLITFLSFAHYFPFVCLIFSLNSFVTFAHSSQWKMDSVPPFAPVISLSNHSRHPIVPKMFFCFPEVWTAWAIFSQDYFSHRLGRVLSASAVQFTSWQLWVMRTAWNYLVFNFYKNASRKRHHGKAMLGRTMFALACFTMQRSTYFS